MKSPERNPGNLPPLDAKESKSPQDTSTIASRIDACLDQVESELSKETRGKVAESVELWLRQHGETGSIAPERVTEAIDIVQLLESLGRLQRFFEADLPAEMPSVKPFRTETAREEVLGRFTAHVLGERFLYNNLDAIFALQRKYEKVPIGPQSPGVFHATSDRHIMQVLKSRFATSDEHQNDLAGTGPFEKAMGLDGVFVTRGHIYRGLVSSIEDILEANAVVQFKQAELGKPHAIGIRSEHSVGRLHQAVNTSFTEAEELAYRKDPEASIRRDALAITIEMIRCTYPPDLTEANSYYEFCLDPKELDPPAALFVAEEAEWYFDEANAFWPEFAEQTAIITREKLVQAIESVRPEVDPFNQWSADLIPLFVELVDQGELDMQNWSYKPPQS